MKRDIGDIIDRWSIAKLKSERIGTPENLREFEAFNSQLPECDSILKQMILDINSFIWKLEAGLKSGKEELPDKNYLFAEVNQNTLSKIGLESILIRDINHLRVSLKNYINKLNDDGFQDIKKNHLSE